MESQRYSESCLQSRFQDGRTGEVRTAIGLKYSESVHMVWTLKYLSEVLDLPASICRWHHIHHRISHSTDLLMKRIATRYHFFQITWRIVVRANITESPKRSYSNEGYCYECTTHNEVFASLHFVQAHANANLKNRCVLVAKFTVALFEPHISCLFHLLWWRQLRKRCNTRPSCCVLNSWVR